MIFEHERPGTPAALVRGVHPRRFTALLALAIAGCVQSPQPSPNGPEAFPAANPAGCERLGPLLLEETGDRVTLRSFALSDPNAFFTVIPFDRPNEAVDVAPSELDQGLPIDADGVTRVLLSEAGTLYACDLQIVEDRVEPAGLRPDCFVPTVVFGCETAGDSCRVDVSFHSSCPYAVEVKSAEILPNADAVTIAASVPFQLDPDRSASVPVDVRLGTESRVDALIRFRLAFLEREFDWPVTVRATRP